MTDLLAALEAGRDHTGLPGCGSGRTAEVFRNPSGRSSRTSTRCLSRPGPLPPERLQAELYGINMLSSRGCPFPCSYCQNEYLMDLYRGQGTFVRYRSLDNVFAEIDEVILRYRPSRLSFSDESFTLNARRLEEFCEAIPRGTTSPSSARRDPTWSTRRRSAGSGRRAAISSTWPSRPGTRASGTMSSSATSRPRRSSSPSPWRAASASGPGAST